MQGGRQHSFTDGVICAKVARYSGRIYHPDWQTEPLRSVGKKGKGKFAEISWDDALDDISQRFSAVAEQYGGKAVWLYYFAETMVLLMRDSINRLARAKGLF